MKYCTYRTSHPSGFWYAGKGITHKVEHGTYKGSGVRFHLAMTLPGFEYETWTTEVLDTFDDEASAYAAEALLVPITALADPFCLNSKAGGLRSAHQTPGKLLRTIRSQARQAAREVRAARARARKLEAKLKADATKQQLKEANSRLRALRKG
jgi:hypothetical protein